MSVLLKRTFTRRLHVFYQPYAEKSELLEKELLDFQTARELKDRLGEESHSSKHHFSCNKCVRYVLELAAMLKEVSVDTEKARVQSTFV